MNSRQLHNRNTLPSNSRSPRRLGSNNALPDNPIAANDTTPTPERNPMGNYSGEQVDYTKGVPLLFAKIRERLTSEEHREKYVKLRRDVYFILADERLRSRRA